MLALTKEKETLKVWHFSYICIYSYEIHFFVVFNGNDYKNPPYKFCKQDFNVRINLNLNKLVIWGWLANFVNRHVCAFPRI